VFCFSLFVLETGWFGRREEGRCERVISVIVGVVIYFWTDKSENVLFVGEGLHEKAVKT
jgi:hypothetical protein